MKSILSFIFAFTALLTSVPSVADECEQEIFTLPVVMYHHISEREDLLGEYVITPEEFENDLKYLKEAGYNTALPSEIEKGDIPENPIMITFDDGFLSTYKYALPILKNYSMTAVCAVVGSLMLEYTENPNTVSDCAYMDCETVKKLRDSGVFEIACHTYNMHSTGVRKGCAKMKNESSEEYRAALTQDFEKFNSLYYAVTNEKTDIIAFPYGSYSDETAEIAEDTGFNIMLTCREKTNTVVPGGGPVVLGRFNRPHGVKSEEFFEEFI